MISMKTILPSIVRKFHLESGYQNFEELLGNLAAEMTLVDKRRFPIKLTKRYET